MPPRIAPHQVVIIPVLRGEGDEAVMKAAADLKAQLKAKGIRVHLDDRDERTPTKMWDAIKKGVPLRIELGAREVAAGQLTHVRRDIGKDSKKTESVAEFVANIEATLDTMHNDLLARAQAALDARMTDVSTIAEMKSFFADETKSGFVRINYDCIKNNSEFEALKKDFSVTTRCLPFADGGKKVIVGRSY
ncbi:MAG: proline--tRNA ligase, partial [Alphaproteobacteria bacterium]|nr:proline--tRNA ligase [Alphaproteobacteria bacterium]